MPERAAAALRQDEDRRSCWSR